MFEKRYKYCIYKCKKNVINSKNVVTKYIYIVTMFFVIDRKSTIIYN